MKLWAALKNSLFRVCSLHSTLSTAMGHIKCHILVVLASFVTLLTSGFGQEHKLQEYCQNATDSYSVRAICNQLDREIRLGMEVEQAETKYASYLLRNPNSREAVKNIFSRKPLIASPLIRNKGGQCHLPPIEMVLDILHHAGMSHVSFVLGQKVSSTSK